MYNKKILIADDNPTHRFLVIEVLEELNISSGDNIKESSNGIETLKILYSGEKFDYLFLDINMPKDGIEVLEELLDHPEITEDLIIIMLTTSDLQMEIDLTKKLKADSFLIKPYNISSWRKTFELFKKIFIVKEELSEKEKKEVEKSFYYINNSKIK